VKLSLLCAQLHLQPKNNVTTWLAIDGDIKIAFLRHLSLSFHFSLPQQQYYTSVIGISTKLRSKNQEDITLLVSTLTQTPQKRIPKLKMDNNTKCTLAALTVNCCCLHRPGADDCTHNCLHDIPKLLDENPTLACRLAPKPTALPELALASTSLL
jgi:hypothetical protein